MKDKKRLVDTTLRDGEQSPFVNLSGEEKIYIAGMLDRIGVYQIEAGIPAIGISEQRTLSKIIENKKNARISVWSRLHPDDVRKSIECHPDVIHVSIPVSYLHIYTKLGKNKSWIYKRLGEVLDIMAPSGCKLSVGFEDVSRADLAFLIKLLSKLESFGTEMVRLADTVGISAPFMIREMVGTVRGFTTIPIEIHAHNDLGMAVANTAEAMKSGALYADTTILGVGERSGNCNMTGLLKLVSPMFDMGVETQDAIGVQEEFGNILQEHRLNKK